jgi:hypothetical protein
MPFIPPPAILDCTGLQILCFEEEGKRYEINVPPEFALICEKCLQDCRRMVASVFLSLYKGEAAEIPVEIKLEITKIGIIHILKLEARKTANKNLNN